jgi:hypothetical protein
VSGPRIETEELETGTLLIRERDMP